MASTRFIPDKITITKRPDGRWDMVTLSKLPGFSCDTEENMGQMTMILEDASLQMELFFSVPQDISLGYGIRETLQAKATAYQLTLSSRLAPGVGGQPGTFIRQQIVPAPREDSE